MKSTIPPSLILLRGLPGSGKSTLAALLSEGRYPVFSVDDFFTDENENYEFKFNENHLAYQKCQNNVEDQMRAGTKKIFVDNTFTLEWELKPYFELALRFNYTVHVVTVENRHNGKNSHGVSNEQLKKMATTFNVHLISPEI